MFSMNRSMAASAGWNMPSRFLCWLSISWGLMIVKYSPGGASSNDGDFSACWWTRLLSKIENRCANSTVEKVPNSSSKRSAGARSTPSSRIPVPVR
ncbi:TPA: hypothetical protein QEK77_001309 [Stenotrophomonas maltophilia]|nr:hypothetical protein [Stenotrophomonas maltophilia]